MPRAQFSLKSLLWLMAVVAIAMGVPLFLRRQAGLSNTEMIVLLCVVLLFLPKRLLRP